MSNELPDYRKTDNIKTIRILRKAYTLTNSDYLKLFGAAILIPALLFITTQIQFFGTLASAFLVGPVCVGASKFFLDFLDGKETHFNTVLSGFRNYGTNLVAGLVMSIPATVFSLLQSIDTAIQVYRALTGGVRALESYKGIFSQETQMWVLIFLALYSILSSALFYFLYFRLADGEISLNAALSSSARSFLKNPVGISGLLILQFVVLVIAMIPCGLGVPLVYPFVIMASAIAYRSLFPIADESRSRLLDLQPDAPAE